MEKMVSTGNSEGYDHFDISKDMAIAKYFAKDIKGRIEARLLVLSAKAQVTLRKIFYGEIASVEIDSLSNYLEARKIIEGLYLLYNVSKKKRSIGSRRDSFLNSAG